MPEGFEDLSDEEKAAMLEAYEAYGETGETEEPEEPEARDEKEEGGKNSGGLLGSLAKGGKKASADVPEIAIKSEEDYIYDDSYTSLLYKGGCEAPMVAPSVEDKFPALSKSLRDVADESLAEYEKNRDEYVAGAKEHYADEPDFFEYGSYYYNNNALLRRLDESVFSYSIAWSAYLGGAHGNYDEHGHTYDVRTGKELRLTDVMTDISGLNDILKEKLLSYYGEDTFFDLEDSFTHFDPDATEYVSEDDGENYSYPYNWTLTPYGIQFYFGPYELAPFAAGNQQVTLSYEEYGDMIADEYIPEKAGSFIYDFTYSTDLFDIDGDGERDYLSVGLDYEDNDPNYHKGIEVIVDDNTAKFDDVYISDAQYTNHYIHLADGRQYVYAETIIADEHKQFYVFDITDGKPEAVDAIAINPESGIFTDEDGYGYGRLMLTDPDNMKMEKLLYLLSTYYGQRQYHVGSDGMPESSEPFAIRTVIDESLTSKRDIECEIVDEAGKVIGGKETIPSGESFTLLKTDGETYVDARISDGRIVRLNITDAEYPTYVDGVSAEDCFEELFYVG